MTRLGPPVPRIVTLALLSGVAAFSVLQSMVLPALPQIRADLHASVPASSWVLSAFLLVSSVAAVVLGRLGDMFGRRRLLLVSMTALLAGSVFAATSTSIEVLVAGRALQGVGAAAFPLAYGLVRETYPPERVPAVVGAVSSTFGVGFAVGLILPAPLLPLLGWPAVFWLSAVIDLVSLVLVARTVPESSDRTPGSVDWWGAVLLAAGLSCLLLAIGQARAWPLAAILLVAVLGALSVLALLLVELRTRDPLVEPRLLRIPAVAAADAVALLVGFALYGAFSVLPQLVQAPARTGAGFGATPLEGGLVLLPTAVVLVAIGPAAGCLGTRFGHARALVAAGLIGVLGYAVLVIGLGSILAIVASTTILGFAVGLALTAVVNLVVESVDPAATGQATGLNTILRTIGGALGAQSTAAFSGSTVSTAAPVDGYRLAFAVCGVALALAAAAAGVVVRRRTPAGIDG